MNILIVDDDPGVRQLLADFIIELNHRVEVSPSGQDALEEFERENYDLVFLDLQMPGMDGFEVLKSLKEQSNECEVIIITAFGSVNSAIQALNMGAYAYINKPFDLLELERIIIRVRELVDLRQAYRLLANERLRSFHLDNLVAVSPVMRSLKKRISALKDSNIPTLIIGETGTGKRFLSRILHFNGVGKESLILQLNAEDIELLMVKGSFTHSDGIHLTLREFPDDFIRQGYGSLILNGLQRLSFQSMDRLASLLAERLPEAAYTTKYRGFKLMGILGSPNKVDNFKILLSETLWDYFLDKIELPPLRQRAECIVPLAQLFFQSIVSMKGGRNFYISQPVREFLRLYDWPGNIAELRVVVDRLAVICPSGLISAKDLQTVQKDYIDNSEPPITDLSGLLTQAEKQLINKTFRMKFNEPG